MNDKFNSDKILLQFNKFSFTKILFYNQIEIQINTSIYTCTDNEFHNGNTFMPQFENNIAK